MPEPLDPSSIDALPGVSHHFQADRDFRTINASSARSQDLVEVSATALSQLSTMTEESGLGSIFRMQATTKEGHFMLFALNPLGEMGPGTRLFGLQTDLTTTIDTIAPAINEFCS